MCVVSFFISFSKMLFDQRPEFWNKSYVRVIGWDLPGARVTLCFVYGLQSAGTTMTTWRHCFYTLESWQRNELQPNQAKKEGEWYGISRRAETVDLNILLRDLPTCVVCLAFSSTRTDCFPDLFRKFCHLLLLELTLDIKTLDSTIKSTSGERFAISHEIYFIVHYDTTILTTQILIIALSWS